MALPLLASDRGTTGAAFLKSGVGARGLALGEAASASAVGVEALYWNPAGLVFLNSKSLMLTYNPMVEGTHYNQAAFAFRLGSWAYGIGYNALTQDSLEGFDEVGNKTGSFTAGDQIFIMGSARHFDFFDLGVNAKWIRSQIDNVTAQTAAADVGLSIPNFWTSKLRHALVAKNLGGTLTFIDQQDPLPQSFIFGNKLEMGTHFVLNLDAASTKGTGGTVATGLEWKPFSETAKGLAVRAGYSTRHNQADKLSGASAGLGFAFKDISIDYAWIPFGSLGNNQAVTLVWRIPTWEASKAKGS